MTQKNNRFQSNSRARDKSNKRVRANNLSSRSTIRPNTTFRSVESDSRSTFTYSLKTYVRSKIAKARPLGRSAVKKTAAGKQSVEVLQNAPIIERAFCRSSSETTVRPRCHMHEDITPEDIDHWNSLAYTPCDIYRECIDCMYFYI